MHVCYVCLRIRHVEYNTKLLQIAGWCGWVLLNAPDTRPDHRGIGPLQNLTHGYLHYGPEYTLYLALCTAFIHVNSEYFHQNSNAFNWQIDKTSEFWCCRLCFYISFYLITCMFSSSMLATMPFFLYICQLLYFLYY